MEIFYDNYLISLLIFTFRNNKETDEGYTGIYFAKSTEKTGFLMSPAGGCLLYKNMRFIDSEHKMESMIALDVIDVRTNTEYTLEFCNHN